MAGRWRHTTLAFLIALIVAIPVAARAGQPANVTGPTNLAWAGCAGTPASHLAVEFDCLANGGAVYTLVGTFSLSEPVAHAVSMDANVEIAFPSLTHVPDFWDVRLAGCNTSDIIVGKGTAPGCDGHLNAFCRGDTNACDVIYSARIAPGTNVLKLDLTLRPPSVTGVALAASPQVYYAFSLSIPMAHAGSCSGCPSSAIASWVSGTVHAVDDLGGSLPDVKVSADFPGASSCAAVNGGGPGCSQVPTRATTWGQLKSLYR